MDATFHESDERLELYALDRLSDSDVIRIEEHLLICDLCRDRLDETADFAFAVREELKINPVPFHQPRTNWLTRLKQSWGRPQFALAGALALALLVLVVLRISQAPLTAVASLQLTAMRGAEVQTVAPSHRLDLTLTDAPESAGALTAELVNGGGARVWQGMLRPRNGNAGVEIPKELAPGDYYLRLSDSPGHLLHEYSFRVAKK